MCMQKSLRKGTGNNIPWKKSDILFPFTSCCQFSPNFWPLLRPGTVSNELSHFTCGQMAYKSGKVANLWVFFSRHRYLRSHAGHFDPRKDLFVGGPLVLVGSCGTVIPGRFRGVEPAPSCCTRWLSSEPGDLKLGNLLPKNRPISCRLQRFTARSTFTNG